MQRPVTLIIGGCALAAASTCCLYITTYVFGLLMYGGRNKPGLKQHLAYFGYNALSLSAIIFGLYMTKLGINELKLR